MPLYENARDLVRANLEQFRPDVKVRVKGVAIGTLTDAQLNAINQNREMGGLPPIIADVLFVGWHVYKSRVLRDGYTISDVVTQIESAMSSEAAVLDLERMTALENPKPRADGYGNMVKDRAVLECTTHHPRPELFSVVPKGDARKPTK